jgi:hypothetical protein
MSHIPMPLHPKAKEFAKSGLFAGVKSFEDLDKRIAAIPANKWKGDGECKNLSVNWKSATSLKEPPLG